ncbi:MAG: UDP-N-acetylmuramate dehydrogenase [Candidatus Wildermuthbacteria bacterium]|nr:UDP-N-acetylmuramate dehydrogenase [Candidatus Wildermuthbacteria bacterium]
MSAKYIKKTLTGIQENISLAEYTTFGIGGKARYFINASTREDLTRAVERAKELKLPFFVLGSGSNLLVADEGFNGLVIKMQNAKYDHSPFSTGWVAQPFNKGCGELQTTKIIAEAGLLLNKLVNISVENGLAGAEWSAGIPGTVGGAVRGNAGAFGTSMKDIVESVEALDIKSAEFKNFDSKRCGFGYRQSIFKKNKNLIIFSAILKLKKEDKEKVRKKVKEYLDYRRERHPKEPSAGSVFKNPPGFFARDLILKCGLGGKKIGGAKISEQHSNFILNFNKARAKDVKDLIILAKQKVKNKFNIKLEEEIEYLG